MFGRLPCVIVFGVAVLADLVQDGLTRHPVTDNLLDDVLLPVGRLDFVTDISHYG